LLQQLPLPLLQLPPGIGGIQQQLLQHLPLQQQLLLVGLQSWAQ
jgi:hypothetical protein